ncbi:inositol monophosphatase family protein [Xylophilus sp.]|uniref:inositol monophosphatase family protein n=1 Tax=Xylophilus sp. TaxID=2653893 RepID=UPI0013B8AE8B|nr:inositol monophosphatase family protein [Xylophilus sp.]KAF1048354.1 MAG: Fructose-1,6-bisphosphatase/inositol-1-monophosphatase [Xylophilus sp.]
MPLPDAALFDQVSDPLRDVAQRLVLPRLRRLRDADVGEKAPGEWVTIVDREAEAALAAVLPRLLPGSRVVAEEAVAAQPSLRDGMGQGWVWLVDPLDGTANLVRGHDDFALMVALLHNGLACGSWIFAPASGSLAVAEHGAGAWLDGARVSQHRRSRH